MYILREIDSNVHLDKMTTKFSQTSKGGHDAVYDYCCRPCDDDQLNAEALFYCGNCRKLFCDMCVGFHDKVLKDHQVLGRAEVARWGKVKAAGLAVMCEEHSDKEEEMYCVGHDLTCCHICINIYHRGCKEVKQVSEVAKGIQITPEFQSFLTHAARTQASLRTKLDKRDKNIKLLQKTRDEIMSSFKDIRKNFNQFMDNVEKESTTKMDRILSFLYKKVQSDIDTYSDLEKEIQKFLDTIKKFGSQCSDFAFQCFKRSIRKLSSAEELLSSMQDEDYQLKFTPDTSLQQFQSSLKTFGKFHITPKSLDPDYLYTVDAVQKHNVRTKTDTQKCSIFGISQLSDGQVAIVDNKNNKVKLLSCSQYSVIAELDLPINPYDICTTTGTELVVTVCKVSKYKLTRSELHFINACSRHLTHARTKQLDHECSGIAFHFGKLYVGSCRAIYEYSVSGEKVKKIYGDTFCQEITVYRFAFSDDGNRIYVTKYNQNCLVTLDKSGHQLSRLADPKLQEPVGICGADNGSVFVCGGTSHNVIQVDSKGQKKMTTLAKKSDGVKFPVVLFYDRKLKQLLLGQAKEDNVIVLKLK